MSDIPETRAGDEVAEFQGFYGPFTVSERLLQKIWLRRAFNLTRAATRDGDPVEVISPGKWNLLEGPDFRGAMLRIGGREVSGDVEVHFRAADWKNHGHNKDAAYNEVVLHVVLFMPRPGEPEVRASSGRAIPVLSLLDLLFHDIEEYAADEAIETAMERSHWPIAEDLLKQTPQRRLRLLRERALGRWERKRYFAGLRIERLGWEDACHQTALEILGYRRNRAAMLGVGARHTLAGLRKERPSAAALFSSQEGNWKLRGCRPANHPLARIEQYLAWIDSRPEWPGELRKIAALFEFDEPGECEPVAAMRRALRIPKLRMEWAEKLTGGAIGGRRFDTLICDGMLPLASHDAGRDLFALWHSWYAGDFPDRVFETLRLVEAVDRNSPVSNGICQGLLSLSQDCVDR